MKKLNFSIVTPIYAYNQQKVDELVRCIESVQKQTYGTENIQHIIVNDGSIVDLTIPSYRHIQVIVQNNFQRIVAYNEGFKKACYDVILMLDADDELVPEALEKINGYYNDRSNAAYKMFNWGCSYVHKDGKITQRAAFRPKMKQPKGHEIFGGGNIVNGTYCFSRGIYNVMGAFPEGEIKNIDCTQINYPAGGSMVRDLTMSSPYDFSAWFQMQFPETREFFMVNVDDEPNKVIKEIGNPWGQDYALFYKYTREHRCKPVDDYLEIVHIR